MHRDGLKSVDIIAQKMIEEDYNPVLVYKPLGEKMVTNANIKEDDFLLGILRNPKWIC